MTFSQWLRAQKKRSDSIGTFANTIGTYTNTVSFRKNASALRKTDFDAWWFFLIEKKCSDSILETFLNAWVEFHKCRIPKIKLKNQRIQKNVDKI